MEIILASNSPRRKQLLKEAGLKFKVIPSDCDEQFDFYSSQEEYAKNLSYLKAEKVFLKNQNCVVIGADTIVVFNNQILGKPIDKTDAFNTLKMLSNNTHKVITGYTIMSKNKAISNYEVTFVTFNDLTDHLINSYIDDKNPLDKAGSYGIQDGYPLVKNFDGDYNNVVGLPVDKILQHLKEFI